MSFSCSLVDPFVFSRSTNLRGKLGINSKQSAAAASYSVSVASRGGHKWRGSRQKTRQARKDLENLALLAPPFNAKNAVQPLITNLHHRTNHTQSRCPRQQPNAAVSMPPRKHSPNPSDPLSRRPSNHPSRPPQTPTPLSPAAPHLSNPPQAKASLVYPCSRRKHPISHPRRPTTHLERGRRRSRRPFPPRFSMQIRT